ncbi:MAG: aldo/keto reductase [Anaerolineae bacterium]|nr:aldo/keto reductase [Anaerolineae bacterium]
MQYRTLGQSGLDVSTIALGYWAVSDPRLWGPQDRGEAIDTVHAALDHGINLIDTAEGYGNGTSETLLGHALADRREEAIIATKVSRGHLQPDQIVTACENSLRRLNTDYIDLYQIHWANPDVPLADSLQTLIKLRDQGKIRALGVSNFGPHDLTAALDIMGTAAPIVSNQIPYNLLFRAIEYAMLPISRNHQVGILAYSPLLHGILTGKFATIDDIPDGRRRTRHFSAERPLARHGEPGIEAATQNALDAIRTIADDAGLPMAQLALAWVLHQPGITAVIMGARSPEQLAANIKASEIALSEDVLAALNTATEGVKTALGDNPDPWQSGENVRVR